MALGMNPQKSSVENQDNTGIPTPQPHRKLGRNNKKIHSYEMSQWVKRLPLDVF